MRPSIRVHQTQSRSPEVRRLSLLFTCPQGTPDALQATWSKLEIARRPLPILDFQCHHDPMGTLPLTTSHQPGRLRWPSYRHSVRYPTITMSGARAAPWSCATSPRLFLPGSLRSSSSVPQGRRSRRLLLLDGFSAEWLRPALRLGRREIGPTYPVRTILGLLTRCRHSARPLQI